MRTLQLDQLNIDICPEAIRNAFTTVEFNHMVSRSNTTQDYYLSAAIEIASLSVEKATCCLYFFDAAAVTRYQEEEKMDISFLPSGLLGKIKESSCAYLHVVLKKQLTCRGEQRNKVIIPIDDEMGYESDNIHIDSAGVQRLTAIMDRFIIIPEKFWEKDPYSFSPSIDRSAYQKSA